MKIKSFLPLITLVLVGNLASCSNKIEGEIYVFAAASLTATMNQIKDKFEAQNPNVKIVYNFDSSGTLKTQIENGARCDLFFSAAPKQMNQLSELGLIDESTRTDMLENKVALVTPDGNPKNVTNFQNLADRLKTHEEGFLFAMGNSDVPVGQYTQKIFDYFEIDESAVSSNITYGSNVSVVATTVKEGGASCGAVYQTDAFTYELNIVDTATKDMCGQVIYPASVIKGAVNYEAAKQFLEYLKGEEATAIFESVGFSKI